MARNTLRLDMSGFEGLLTELDKVGGDVRRTSELALKKAAVQIMNDTIIAADKPNLPAQGKYSRGDTTASIIHWPKVEWDGTIAWVPVGFDFSKLGSGGFLIAGTPRMEPDVALRKMYKGKKYMSEVSKMMQDVVWTELLKQWGK